MEIRKFRTDKFLNIPRSRLKSESDQDLTESYNWQKGLPSENAPCEVDRQDERQCCNLDRLSA